jgi:ATP-dependent DNA helicase RecG
MSNLGMQDLDLDAMARWFRPGRPLDTARLQTLKLLRTDQGRLYPRAMPCFCGGKEREFHFPDAWVQCGRFRGQEKVDIFDQQQDIHAHLPDAVTAIEMFLKKHAYKSARFGAMQRDDVWSIPLAMLREAIVNALVHSDYAQRGTPIRVAFFDDRIDIESPGFLLPGMTVQDMQSGVSRIRNPVIARVFRELHLTEQWGSGVRRIFSEASTQGLPEPCVEEIATGVRLRVFLATPHDPGVTATPTPSLAHINAQVGEQVMALLRHCVAQPRSKQELLAELGLSNAYLNYKRHIVPLLEQGLLVMTLPDKPQSRLQRYRLTPQGQTLLAALTTKESPAP